MERDSDVKNLTILNCFNAQSICNKLVNVLEYLKLSSTDICAIQETWFKGDDGPLFKIMKEQGFNVLSVLWKNKSKGGGVCFIFKKQLTLDLLRSEGYKTFELIEANIKNKIQKIRICNIYRTENATRSFFNELSKFLQDSANESGLPIIIADDFSIHVDKPNLRLPKNFINLLQTKEYAHHISQPTHRKCATLDLVMSRITDSNVLSFIDSNINPCKEQS